VDTLRSDHLGSYGYIRKTSPFFDAIAKEGIFFKNAFVPMSTTVPSHASLFTSLYPMQLGVLKNGHMLDDSFLTMSEIFKEMGFTTAGIASTDRHFKAGNLNQGFDYFNEPTSRVYYRPANETVSVAIDLIDRFGKDEKFFLWIHVFDPHWPIRPPLNYYEYLRKGTHENLLFKYLIEKQHIDFDYFDKDRNAMLQLITAYDSEILFVDTELQRFFEHYEKKGFKSNSLWIITADHGEGLGSHSWWEHGKHLYNEQLRVPLVFYFSSGIFKGKFIEDVVETVDIFPTVFELISGKINRFDGIQGESLTPFMLSEPNRKYHKIYAFGQRRIYAEKPKMTKTKYYNFDEGDKYSLQTKNYKYIYRSHGKDEFYDLREDPYEINNLIDKGLIQEKKLKEILISKINEFKGNQPSRHLDVNKEAIERLKSLGYIQ
jgi:arylsulfatase A-like enzyme